jgi:hypothetical protein
MAHTVPTSGSIYRGQSRKGIGEGAESPIAHGEQYLDASPPLGQDTGLLEEIRPWMSLGLDPADQQRLNDRLEGWSFLQYRDLQLVARLVSAGFYDDRAAYFAHGRVWPLGGAPGFDPGLHLGRSEAFESPWRNDDPGQRVPEPVPALVRPEQIVAEPEAAVHLLAQLLQACVHRHPLIIAAPITAFAAGSPLHALVSFARAALPADLRQECRIRIYTRTPELFLRNRKAVLLAIPAEAREVIERILRTRREATLVDRQGKLLAGEPLEPTALAYAEAVLERALRIPDGLTAFGERFRDRRSQSGMPDARDVRAIQVTYNLAVALAGSPEERGDLLRSYLPRAAQKLGPEADWQQLITPEEWRSFPSESLLDLLLMDSATLSPGARELQKAVESAVAQLGRTVEARRLADWWDPAEPAKLRRLQELAIHQPPLISDAALAERTTVLPLRRIAETGAAEAILAAELRHGSLRQRAAESGEMGKLASSPGILRILLQAVERGTLDAAWARVFLEEAPDPALAAVAPELLQASGLFNDSGRWGEVPKLLLDRLRKLRNVPQGLASPILQAGRALDPASNLPIFLGLAELLDRIDKEVGHQGENVLIARLWREMPAALERQDREALVEVALSPQWRCLQPSSLASQGKLRPAGLEAMASRLVAYEDLLRELDTPSLLRLAGPLESREDLERIFDFVDLRLARDLRSTVDTLTLSGWWTACRRLSRLLLSDPDVRRRAAQAWMTSRAWLQERMEAILEDWEWAMESLPKSLDTEGMAALWAGEAKPRPLWPWIPPFERDQLQDVVEKAPHLTALAELTEALENDSSRLDLGERPHRYVLRCSWFARELPEDALGWLLAPETRGNISPLDLESSLRLWQLAGSRADRALEARRRVILHCLKKDERAQDAILGAGEPNFWSSPDFLSGLAAWIARQGSVKEIGEVLLKHVEGHIAGEPDRRPQEVPESLVRELTRSGRKRTAFLLSPELSRAAAKETLMQSVLDALVYGWREHACWRELAEEIERSPGGEHPLSFIAAEIRRQGMQRGLSQVGWDTFETAARKEPRLVSFRADGPAVLPVFDLAATLARPGGVGGAALRVVFSAGKDLRVRSEWWEALLQGLSTWRRYPPPLDCPDDRKDVAMALMMQSLDDLGQDEQQAFWQALQRRSDNLSEWDLPRDFGKR